MRRRGASAYRDAVRHLAGLRESIQRRARFCYGDYQRALHEAIALVEAAQQRLADRGQSDMADEFQPYFDEAMKRPGFRAAHEAALRDEENTDG